jgi:RimJ/RimL family protein N-acetyltransferase
MPLPTGLLPARQPLQGTSARLEPIDPARHAGELYAASHGVAGGEALWRFLGYGPWADAGAFQVWLRDCAAVHDPLFFAIREHGSGAACGMASYLNIVPKNGSIEIGHIWLAPALQRTRAATEALFLLMRYAMDDLATGGWSGSARPRGLAQRARRLGFRFEGIFHRTWCQGPQPRHRLVFDHRVGMAGGARQHPGLAGARTISMRTDASAARSAISQGRECPAAVESGSQRGPIATNACACSMPSTFTIGAAAPARGAPGERLRRFAAGRGAA